MKNTDAQRRKQTKTPVTNLFKHPGYQQIQFTFSHGFPLLYTKLVSCEITRLSSELTIARLVFLTDLTLTCSHFVVPTSYTRPPCRKCACLRDRKLHISVYKVLRINIFLKLMDRFTSEVLY